MFIPFIVVYFLIKKKRNGNFYFKTLQHALRQQIRNRLLSLLVSQGKCNPKLNGIFCPVAKTTSKCFFMLASISLYFCTFSCLLDEIRLDQIYCTVHIKHLQIISVRDERVPDSTKKLLPPIRLGGYKIFLKLFIKFKS